MADQAQDVAVLDDAAATKRHELEASAVQAKVLDTPRTREACRRLGLLVDDLQARPMESFAEPGDSRDKVMMRFHHNEKKRKERLGNVLAERAKVMTINAQKGEKPGAQSGQFLSMLESLFEKEAKRLEGDLRGQLRQHSAVARENEIQLRLEAHNAEKEARRDERRKEALHCQKELGDRARMTREGRFERHNQNQAQLDAEFKDKQDKFALGIVAEEERIRRFKDDLASVNHSKADQFNQKMDAMRTFVTDRLTQQKEQGEDKLLQLQARLQDVDERRDRNLRQRQLRGEEQHLHLMDVRDEKNRLDRVNGYRRAELRDEIAAKSERVDTLVALRDQLLNARKARTTKAEAKTSSRGVSLRRDCAPGPGHYEAPPSCLTEIPAPKMVQSTVTHSEFIDQMVRATKANPAPGHYDQGPLPNGDALRKVNGGAFSTNQKTSFLDEAMKAKESIPAPGRYESQTQLDHRALKMRRDRVNDTGADKFSKKRYPVWARAGTDTPGPASYTVDEYMRKDVLRRAQLSLPALTRDMIRT